MGLPDVYTWIAWSVALLGFFLGAQTLGVTAALFLVVLAIVGLTVAGWLAGRRVRARMSRREPRFIATGEIFRDPSSGRPTRVYVDPQTGERRYIEE